MLMVELGDGLHPSQAATIILSWFDMQVNGCIQVSPSTLLPSFMRARPR